MLPLHFARMDIPVDQHAGSGLYRDQAKRAPVAILPSS